jgi:hypothetical protein
MVKNFIFCFQKEFSFVIVEEPGESDDDRRILPRAIQSSISGTIEDENDNRKQQIVKKKRKRFD